MRKSHITITPIHLSEDCISIRVIRSGGSLASEQAFLITKKEYDVLLNIIKNNYSGSDVNYSLTEAA